MNSEKVGEKVKQHICNMQLHSGVDDVHGSSMMAGVEALIGSMLVVSEQSSTDTCQDTRS
jgi:hypothetical protein